MLPATAEDLYYKVESMNVETRRMRYIEKQLPGGEGGELKFIGHTLAAVDAVEHNKRARERENARSLSARGAFS